MAYKSARTCVGLIGAACLLAISPSITKADDQTEFRCAKPGTRLAFSNRAPVEIIAQEGFVCLVKGAEGKTFRMLLGMSSYSAWVDNHVERLFPFKVGNEVDFTSSGDSSHIAANLTETQTLYYHDNVKVLRQERIDTKMGSFNTWVIEDRQFTQGRISGTWVTTYWWAPEVGYTVKRTFETRAGIGTDETLQITSLETPPLSSPSVTSSVPPAPTPSVPASPAASAPTTPAAASSAAGSIKGAKTTSTTPPAASSPATAPAVGSVADRLQALKDLLDRKLITPSEYEAKRKAILDAM